jgi:hypothetical protein
METSVRVPNLGGRIPTPSNNKKPTTSENPLHQSSSGPDQNSNSHDIFIPSWMQMFGSEITLLLFFLLILLVIYQLSWEFAPETESQTRRNARTLKVFNHTTLKNKTDKPYKSSPTTPRNDNENIADLLKQEEYDASSDGE